MFEENKLHCLRLDAECLADQESIEVSFFQRVDLEIGSNEIFRSIFFDEKIQSDSLSSGHLIRLIVDRDRYTLIG